MHRCGAHGSEPRTCAPHPFGRLFETGKPRGCFRRYSEHFARPLFIFVFDMEIQGAAIATMLSNTAASIYFILFICKKGDGLSIRLSPKCYTLTQHIPADVLSVGLPSFMISMMATVSNTALNRIIAAYSTEAVAGMGIAKKIDMPCVCNGSRHVPRRTPAHRI